MSNRGKFRLGHAWLARPTRNLDLENFLVLASCGLGKTSDPGPVRTSLSRTTGGMRCTTSPVRVKSIGMHGNIYTILISKGAHGMDVIRGPGARFFQPATRDRENSTLRVCATNRRDAGRCI